MNEMKKEIIEYYSNLIDEVDIKCEQEIKKYDTNKQIVDEINLKRDKMISKIKETQKKHLTGLTPESEYPFDHMNCILFVRKENLREPSGFKFELAIGRLLIVNTWISKRVLKKLESPPSGPCCRLYGPKKEFNSFQDAVKYFVIGYLITTTDPNEFILDLTEPEQNILNKLKISGFNNPIKDTDFDFLPNVLNLNKLKKLSLFGSTYSQLPKNFFKCFYNIEHLSLSIDLKFLREKLFVDLKNLREIELCVQTSKFTIQENAFFGLSNLEKLIIRYTLIEYLDDQTFQGLENLKILELERVSIKKQMNNFLEPLKKLQNLSIGDYKVNTKANKYQPIGFNDLKCLQIDDSYDMISIEQCKNLELLSTRNYNLKSEVLSGSTQLKLLRCAKGKIEDVNFLKIMTGLEFLDITLTPVTMKQFEKLELPSLKFLMLTCESVPLFNVSLSNLQGLYLSDCKFLSRDRFVNLSSLEFIHFENITKALSEKFLNLDHLNGLKGLKYFGFEAGKSQGRSEENCSKLIESFSSLFEVPESVICYPSFNHECKVTYQLTGKISLNEDRLIGNQYFAEYLKISDNVREHILKKQSDIFYHFIKSDDRSYLRVTQ